MEALDGKQYNFHINGGCGEGRRMWKHLYKQKPHGLSQVGYDHNLEFDEQWHLGFHNVIDM